MTGSEGSGTTSSGTTSTGDRTSRGKTNDDKGNDGKGNDGKGNGVPWQLLFGAAALIGTIYIVFAIIAFNRADDTGLDESAWLRTVFVIQGIEAIAFTAIGWLFGREVHRGEAKVAEKQAEEAKQDAKEAQAETGEAREAAIGAVERAAAAEKDGQRLAEAIRARAAVPKSAPGPGGDERAPAGGAPVGAGGLAELRALADSLFPPP
ncbi:hypothetical protein [Intrasporangium sp.]|uniref:hypothetical protein n=1 Tax=Intrasporangium sp. TaxID=1925024 RepID=UPI002939C902|nr:hypothetical protein [Intrasporangium sp.]MDV3222682.1 hypothetical protein [Intrasporangium sp.]